MYASKMFFTCAVQVYNAYLHSVCVCGGGCAYITCVGQDNSKQWLSLHHGVLGIELKSLGVCDECLYLLSHLTGPVLYDFVPITLEHSGGFCL